MFVVAVQEADLPALCVHLRNQIQLHRLSVHILFLRRDTGIVIKYGDVKMRLQVLQHIAGARSAAAVKEKRRAFPVQAFENGVQFSLVIDFWLIRYDCSSPS